MLISHRKKFIYTKTVRTGGTSVESYFEKFCMPEGVWQFTHGHEEYVTKEGVIGYRGEDAKGKQWINHMPAIEIRNKIGAAIWGSYFKFCVIRNPFDKLISGFFYMKKKKQNRSTHRVEQTKTENPIKRFRSWVKSGGSLIDRDKYMINDEICIDYFIRYEDLRNGIQHVCNLLNIRFEPERIPKLKSGLRDRKIPLIDFYDEETIQIVSRIYDFELKEFGYSMPE